MNQEEFEKLISIIGNPTHIRVVHYLMPDNNRLIEDLDAYFNDIRLRGIYSEREDSKVPIPLILEWNQDTAATKTLYRRLTPNPKGDKFTLLKAGIPYIDGRPGLQPQGRMDVEDLIWEITDEDSALTGLIVQLNPQRTRIVQAYDALNNTKERLVHLLEDYSLASEVIRYNHQISL